MGTEWTRPSAEANREGFAWGNIVKRFAGINDERGLLTPQWQGTAGLKERKCFSFSTKLCEAGQLSETPINCLPHKGNLWEPSA